MTEVCAQNTQAQPAKHYVRPYSDDVVAAILEHTRSSINTEQQTITCDAMSIIDIPGHPAKINQKAALDDSQALIVVGGKGVIRFSDELLHDYKDKQVMLLIVKGSTCTVYERDKHQFSSLIVKEKVKPVELGGTPTSKAENPGSGSASTATPKMKPIRLPRHADGISIDRLKEEVEMLKAKLTFMDNFMCNIHRTMMKRDGNDYLKAFAAPATPEQQSDNEIYYMESDYQPSDADEVSTSEASTDETSTSETSADETSTSENSADENSGEVTDDDLSSTC